MIKTTEIKLHCPDIKTVVDAMEARDTLENSPGLDEVVVDHRTGDVRIVTSNADEGTNALDRLAGAGYPAENVEKANLKRPLSAEHSQTF